MANPKHRHSKTRRDKRRTQDKLKIPLFRLVKDGSCHLPHFAYRVGDDLYYAGKVFVKGYYSSSRNQN